MAVLAMSSAAQVRFVLTGCFYNLRVLFVAVLKPTGLLFGAYKRALIFRKFPYGPLLYRLPCCDPFPDPVA